MKQQEAAYEIVVSHFGYADPGDEAHETLFVAARDVITQRDGAADEPNVAFSWACATYGDDK